jgi:tetratricopeptide (TPR) repeat protein
MLLVLSGPSCVCAGNLSLPPQVPAILDHIYSGRSDLAIPEARQLEQQRPEHPLGYLLEAEAEWWNIWCTSAEFKYGMTMARHRERLSSDVPYLDLTEKAYELARKSYAQNDTAEMRLYAGMADALAARLHGLRGEGRATARAGVRARDNFLKALALDASMADADMGLGLYNFYVDTLSPLVKTLRIIMGIPGGSKEEGIRQLQRAITEGQLTPSLARFYLAINLHNYEHKYEEALEVLTPLAEKYPGNALWQLARGDLNAKLGKKQQALKEYRAAAEAAEKIPDEECRKRVDSLVRESLASVGGARVSPGQ